MRDDWFSGRRRRTRTVKVWTALSRPCPAGQTDNGGFFSKIRTESGQRTDSRQTESGQTDTGQKIRTESGQQTDTGQDFPENPDKNETRTGHGQCCPPTSVLNRLIWKCWNIVIRCWPLRQHGLILGKYLFFAKVFVDKKKFWEHKKEITCCISHIDNTSITIKREHFYLSEKVGSQEVYI